MKQRFDAIVVGAGPAGCACGYTLAKAGLEVLVVERGKFAGAKNMWGGVFYGPTLNQLFPNFWQEAPVERQRLPLPPQPWRQTSGQTWSATR